MDGETCNEAASSAQLPSSRSSALMEDFIKMLRGETDSGRLAGLLLVTKVCNNGDHSAILQVYQAIGSKFLLRLLCTGMGKGGGGGGGGGDEYSDAYLKLSVTVLAAFCRVPQIAASPDMLPIIPLLLQILFQGRGHCYEFLFLTANAQEDGSKALFEFGGIQLLASQMPTLPDGSNVLKLAMKLVQLLISKLPAEEIYIKHPLELAMLVVAAAERFGLPHTDLKFEALHLLSAILSSQHSAFSIADVEVATMPPACVLEALRSMDDSVWSANMRAGVVAILINRVAPADKVQALFLAECTISIVGEEWLIGPVKLPDVQDPIPASRCLQLVFGTSSVEIAVLLNEYAYLRDKASKSSPSSAETITLKCRNLGIMFLLVEKVIKLVSKFGESEQSQPDPVISDSILMNIISGLNETVNVVLEYLQDAKEHGQNKEDDLLASVRIIGSYLAEDLMLAEKSNVVKDNDTVVLGCDTVLNFLLNGGNFWSSEVDACLFKLLGAMCHWTEKTSDFGIIMMASSICALILDSTSEKALLCHPDFSSDDRNCLSQLIKNSLAVYGKGSVPDNAKEEVDLMKSLLLVTLVGLIDSPT